MASGGAPDFLGHRNGQLAYYFALPLTNKQIMSIMADKGYSVSENRISIIRNSPLMKALVSRIQSQLGYMILQKHVETAGEKLDSFIHPALDKLEELMHGADNESVRLSSVKTVLDYAPNAPKQTKVSEVNERRKVSFDDEAMKTLRRALGRGLSHLNPAPPATQPQQLLDPSLDQEDEVIDVPSRQLPSPATQIDANSLQSKADDTPFEPLDDTLTPQQLEERNSDTFFAAQELAEQAPEFAEEVDRANSFLQKHLNHRKNRPAGAGENRITKPIRVISPDELEQELSIDDDEYY